MEIREIQSKGEWEGFLAGCKDKTFLQSWSWGEFQEMMRDRVWRLGVFEGKDLMAVALVVKVKAKRGTFLLVPHGPISIETVAGRPVSRQEVLKVLVEKLKQIAKQEEAGFIRINPIWSRSPENISLFKTMGFRDAPIQMHPEASWKLNIIPPSSELLLDMRKTTRYLIRQASQNPDITVFQSNRLEDVRLFSAMHEKVSKRQAFIPFSLEYLEKEFSVFQKDNAISIFFGKYKDEIAAASFVVFWSGIGFYHHAASLPQYAKLSIPYLLQWEAIKETKNRRCVLYDFWGYVDPKKEPNHPWAGPTLFKMGFGGDAHEYVKTQDLPLSWKYLPTALFEKVRKIRRHL
ncbi:MAG: peptidoglycan bridge formation glycyltransferase FemA/FemB family protein [bacterium]|nr:peptidoglycan bridge formation glycyltransferase FemA/FemB family protein [bacterium]